MPDGRSTNEDPGASGRRRVARLLRPDRAYLTLSLSFGIAFILLTPPFQVPDEPAHFRRAFELSEGHIIAGKQDGFTGDDQPRALDVLEERYHRLFLHHEEKVTTSEILDGATIRINSEDRGFASFSNAAIHPPVTYLPQTAGIFIARHLSGSVLVCVYAGRLANLLAATAVTCLAIRLTPVGKWSFAALALTPMMLSLSGSLSADGLTNALAFLLVSQAFAMALGPHERVASRSIVLFALSGMALGLAKQAYFLLPLCYLMIPIRKLGNPLRYWTGLAIVMGATLLAVGIWGIVVREIYSPSDPRLGMNPAEQFRLMRSDPVEFLFVLLRTIGFTKLYVEEFIGWLGFADIRLASWVYVVELLLLAMVFATEFGLMRGVKARQTLTAAAVAMLVTLSVMVIVHLTWDPVGAKDVSLQGRYLIPVGPLMALVVGRTLGGFAPKLLSRLPRALPAAVAAVASLVLLAAIARVHERYFVDTPQDAAQRSFVEGLTLEQNGDQDLRARQCFEEAVRICPTHVASHFELANLLARHGDYPEAIRLFRDTLTLDPSDANVKGRLADAQRALKDLEEMLRLIAPVFQALIRSEGLSETRYPDTRRAGTYLKSNRGRVVDAIGRAPFSAEFLWRCPAPDGTEIQLSGAAPSPDAGRGWPFWACSARPVVAGKRIFVFAPPVGAVLFPDEEISWFFQRPLVDLSAAEREREADYRRQHGLRFPLAAPPD